MHKTESAVIKFFMRKKTILFFIVITVLALALRLSLFDHVSRDMRIFLIPWYEQFVTLGGLKGLGTSIGDYNLLYQTIIAFIAQFGADATTYMYVLKALSVVFDFALALLVAGMLTKEYERSATFFVFVYAIVLFLPTGWMNSALWGQCDAIYVTFLMLTLWSLWKNKNFSAFVFYGLALAFKLQAIFLFPFLVTWYFCKKQCSAWHLLISIAVVWASGIVAFCFGRSLWAPLQIYANQTGSYAEMWLNFPSLWVLFGDSYKTLCVPAYLLTIAVLGIGFLYCLSGKKKIETLADALEIAAWMTWTALLFLPSMHERYGYFLDLLLLTLCFTNRKMIKFLVITQGISVLTYGRYLFANGFEMNTLTAAVYLAAYVGYSILITEKDNRYHQEDQ